MRDDGLGWLGERGRDGGIDTLPLPIESGALSLCGKHAVGPDHFGALDRCGATTVVCLVEPHELQDRYPEYVAWLRKNNGGSAVWFPIHDLHAPGVDAAAGLLDDLVMRVRRGEHLLVHCAAGIGRAGTIAACVLVRLGMHVDAALAHVAAHRPMAGPQAPEQLELIEAVAARMR